MTVLVDTLEFWHPDRNISLPADYFDWSAVVRGSSADRLFRIKNMSAMYDAVSVAVTLQTLNLAEVDLTADLQHFLSVDGARFSASVNLGTLAAGATSAPVHLRRVVAPTADVGAADFQILAHAESWA